MCDCHPLTPEQRVPDWQFFAEAARDGCDVYADRLIDAIRIALYSRRIFRIQRGSDIAYGNDGHPITVRKSRYAFRHD